MGRFHEKKLLFLWILSMLPLLMKCIYCRNAGCVISRATPYQSRIKVQLNSSNAKDKRSILLDEFWEHFNWNWEDDGRILLSRNSRERLQVPVEIGVISVKETWIWAKATFSSNQDLSCRAAGDSEMISEASFRARDAFCSPSAAITWRFSLIGVMRFSAGFGQ